MLKPTVLWADAASNKADLPGDRACSVIVIPDVANPLILSKKHLRGSLKLGMLERAYSHTGY